MMILNPLVVLIYLFITAIDITMFFLLVRLVCSRWRNPWLIAFDGAGSKLVDKVMTVVRNATGKLTKRQLTERGCLISALIVLQVIKIVLCNL